MNHAIHHYPEIVRFEDVDIASIVYHPVYLNYLERARSQSLIDRGTSFKKMIDMGLGLVIAHVEMKYIRPLRLEDRFHVLSQVDTHKESIIQMTQAIVADEKDCPMGTIKENLRHISSLHFYAHLKLVVIAKETMRPTPMPQWLEEALLSPLPKESLKKNSAQKSWA